MTPGGLGEGREVMVKDKKIGWNTDSCGGRMERNVLFNNALNTILCQIYGKGPSRQQKRKFAATTTYSTLSDYQQGVYYMHHPTDKITHTTVYVTPVLEHWLEWEITPWVHHEALIPWVNTFTMELQNSILWCTEGLMNKIVFIINVLFLIKCL